MKLNTILETAAAGSTSAGSIATTPFTTPISTRRRRVPSPRRVAKLALSESTLATFDVRTAILFEYDRDQSGAGNTLSADKNAKIVNDVNDRVSNAVKRSQVDDKTLTSTFGLQDADGKVVKVTVKRDQAQEFESRLNSMLADVENPKEIAEVLFMLKKDYDIVDVEWSEPITEDDEAPADPADEDLALDAAGEDEEVDDTDSDTSLDSTDDDLESKSSPDLQASTVQLLQQVIDLLKSETEVRTATANVATAKAETELQDVEQQKQDKEIAQQQEIADMEEFEDEEKEQKKNERLLARIAKFRSAKQQSGEVQ